MADLEAWVAATNPSRDEIAKAIDLGRVPKFLRLQQRQHLALTDRVRDWRGLSENGVT